MEFLIEWNELEFIRKFNWEKSVWKFYSLYDSVSWDRLNFSHYN